MTEASMGDKIPNKTYIYAVNDKITEIQVSVDPQSVQRSPRSSSLIQVSGHVAYSQDENSDLLSPLSSEEIKRFGLIDDKVNPWRHLGVPDAVAINKWKSGPANTGVPTNDTQTNFIPSGVSNMDQSVNQSSVGGLGGSRLNSPEASIFPSSGSRVYSESTNSHAFTGSEILGPYNSGVSRVGASGNVYSSIFNQHQINEQVILGSDMTDRSAGRPLYSSQGMGSTQPSISRPQHLVDYRLPTLEIGPIPVDDPIDRNLHMPSSPMNPRGIYNYPSADKSEMGSPMYVNRSPVYGNSVPSPVPGNGLGSKYGSYQPSSQDRKRHKSQHDNFM